MSFNKMENQKDEEINFPLLIDKMMYRFYYFPNVTEFISINKEIPDKNNFSKIFNHFLTKLIEFDKNFTNYISLAEESETIIHLQYEGYLTNYLKDNDNEVKEYIKKIWDDQLESNIRHICFFIILVEKYANRSGKISEYDKNILFWTILFHDLGKYQNMNPLIKEKIDTFYFDKTHPFKSILIFLNSAFEHDLFYYPNDEYKNELNNIYKDEFINSIYKSWNLESNDYNRNFYNISFKYIEIIEKFFMKIKSQEKNEWIYDICILITFHQSLPNNEYRMNSPLLEEKYFKIFFNKRLAELMRIIMVYDSSSHTMFYGSDWPEQINKNMDKIMTLFE